MPLRDYLTITAQLALYAVAGLMALMSGLVFFPIALMGLFSLFSLVHQPTVATFAVFAWCALASYAAVRNTMAFIDLLNDFNGRQWVFALLWSLAVPFACPLWWWWPF